MYIYNLLDQAANAYYAGKPFMSDDVFDKLAEKYGYEKLGAKVVSGSTLDHPWPLFSLEKRYEGEDEYPFPISEKTVTSDKLDGAAISIVYEDGILVAAVTRGDGKKGENVTRNILQSDLVPAKINATGTVQIVGEIVAPIETPNARNYASGALFLKDVDEFNSRDLYFVAHDARGVDLPTYIDIMNWLHSQYIVTVLNWSILDQEFPTDGQVVRLNSQEEYYAAGFTAKSPKGAFAIKKRTDVAIEPTKLLEVEWQVGKIGKVTPVAIFEEIEIEGAKISRATLHNPGFIEDLDLHIGDTILVTRSGSIIPKVVGKL